VNKLKRLLLLGGVAMTAGACQNPGVYGGSLDVRTFDVTHDFDLTIPADAGHVDAWFALPDDGEPLQKIRNFKIAVDAPDGATVAHREVRDAFGNRFLYLEADGAAGSVIGVTTTFTVKRTESVVSVDPAATRPLNDAERGIHASSLAMSTNIVATPEIRAAAEQAIGGEQNPILAHRRLYDWTLDHVQYWVKSPDYLKSSGIGSSTYTFEQCTGNCTDFHSLYTAAARSQGLPTRMVYGSFFKGPLDGVEKDQSYHCWIEFWAPKIGWVPLDVAVADLYLEDFEVSEANADLVSLTLADGYYGPDPAMVDYYFGNLDARRVTWHRGRDLELQPTPAGGPVNALPKCYVEIDGVASKAWTRTLTFREKR